MRSLRASSPRVIELRQAATRQIRSREDLALARLPQRHTRSHNIINGVCQAVNWTSLEDSKECHCLTDSQIRFGAPNRRMNTRLCGLPVVGRTALERGFPCEAYSTYSAAVVNIL